MKVLNVDKIGKDEIMICIDQHVIILKFDGSVNKHTYEVFYLKRSDLASSGRNSVFYGATMYNVTGDGKEDIIIHMDDIITNVGMRIFAYIYKADFTLDIDAPYITPEKFNVHQNYLNPFNPSTHIDFMLMERAKVTLKVYNTLGQEIKTLVNEDMIPGYDSRIFEGKDLPSGVYFYELVTDKTRITKKWYYSDKNTSHIYF